MSNGSYNKPLGDPHGYTDEPVPQWPAPVAKHIHSAWYDAAGKLTDTCGVCGHDLRHSAHYRKNP